jgi:hypothetical protein
LKQTNLEKVFLNTQQQNHPPELIRLMVRLKGKPFYCTKTDSKNIYCCLWHCFPPKRSDGSYSQLYPFQSTLVRDLQVHKRIALLKARNLGATQIALTYGLYLTLCEQREGNYMFLTGVGYTLSRTLARRAKAMLATRDIHFDDNSTTLSFPHCRWSFYGSDSKQYLGQSEVTYLVADEISSFDPYSDWKSSIDTFAIKNAGATIWLITTPSAKVSSQAHRVFTEEDSKSLYYRVYLSYKEALGTMLQPESIELLQRTSESFPMMYDLKWGYSFEGSCFNATSINNAITKGNYEHNPSADKILGIDIGFGSSATAYTVLQLNDSLAQVLYTTEMVRSDFNDTIIHALELIRKYDPSHVYVDSSAPSYIRALKAELPREEVEYEQAMERYNKMGVPFENNMRVIPVPFSTKHKDMLAFCKLALDSGLVAINESKHPKLVQELRMVTERDGRVQKDLQFRYIRFVEIINVRGKDELVK